MYKKIIRPLLFLLTPETIHKIIMVMLRVAHFIPGARCLLRVMFTIKHPALEREVFGLKFPNPIGLAAGFDKDAEAYMELSSFGFGFIEVGTITPRPQPGNPKPRLFRLPDDTALVNRMGFNNHGIDNASRNLRHRHLHFMGRKNRLIIGGNLGKNTTTRNEDAPSDYLKPFRSLYENVEYFVVNVSCPNVKNMTSLQNKSDLTEILRPMIEFRRGQNHYRPILLKISPDLTEPQIDNIIEVLIECGLDGVVATNTTTSRDGLKTPQPIIEYVGNGGLSGAPLTHRSVEMVRYIHKKTEGRFPIIGVGGIMTEDDAIAMLDAGASLIQIYTGFIYNGPTFAKRICKRIIQRAEEQKK